jgi:hypothetical protein
VPAFDLDLTDPSAADLEKAMARAVEEANLRCRVGLMPPDRATYRRFITHNFAAAPEGVALWVGDEGRVETYPPTPRATLLGVAWRTTPAGRRVRVVGRRVEPFREGPGNRFGPPWRRWPPLCYLDPDHVVTRQYPGSEPEAVALCGCGAVGPPDRLGWMEGRCGPCHDHLQDKGTPLAGEGPPALRTAGQLLCAGFTPSGRTVVAVEWVAPREAVKVAVWDRKTGAHRSPDDQPVSGRLVEPERFASGVTLSRGYRVYWFDDEAQGPVPSRGCPNYGCVAVAFEGALATTLRYDGSAWRRDLTSESGWQEVWPERRGGRHVIYFSLALSPDGQRIALGMTECSVELLGRSGADGPTLRPPLPAAEIERQRVYAVAFSPDGALLAAGAGRSGFVDDPSENWFGRGGGLYLYDVARAELLAAFPTPRDDVTALAFAPDGALLFAGSTDCTIRVVEVQTRQEVAVLSGHIGGVNGLAFSPDGQLLASAGGDGLVRLWPWRQVLGRPAPTAGAPARRRKRS